MNRILLTLKRPFIWLYRFRHRCGYGVHSPFAFNLITHVIYESTAYYKYEELAKAQKQLELEKDKRWKYESKKVKRLLFRLVNYTQPETIVDAGTLAASALYLKAGKEGGQIILRLPTFPSSFWRVAFPLISFICTIIVIPIL